MERLQQIIEILSSSQECFTSEYLGKCLGVSARTIRNDIKVINETYLDGAKIVGNKGKGYQLLGKVKRLKANLYYDSFEQRIIPIVYKVVNAKDRLTYGQLATELLVSTQTIKNDLKKISDILKKENRNLKLAINIFLGLQLEGNEIDKRLLLAAVIKKYSGKMIYDDILISIQEIFDNFVRDEELKIIQFSIEDTLRDFKVVLDRRLLYNLVIHIVIMIQRIANGNLINIKAEDELIYFPEYRMAEEICHKLANLMNLSIPDEEVKYLNIHLISQKINLCNNRNLYRRKNIKEIVVTALENVRQMYKYDFMSDEELLDGLLTHMYAMVYRLEYKIYINNPIITNIKQEFADAYDIALAFVQHISKDLNVNFNDHEVGYVALHFATYVEKHGRIETRVMIVCGTGIGTSGLLLERIKNEFPDIYIVGVYSLYNYTEALSKDVDFILTTVDIDECQLPVIKVNQLLDDKQVSAVKERIRLDSLKKRITPDNFLVLKSTDKESALQELLREIHLEHIYESIMVREELSSTNIGNGVALPHPINFLDDYNKIYFAVCKNEIMWGNGKVSLIILVIPGKREVRSYGKIIKDMYYLVKDPVLVYDISKVTNYAEFINKL